MKILNHSFALILLSFSLLSSGCASLPSNIQPPSRVVDYHVDGGVEQRIEEQRLQDGGGVSESGVHLLDSGMDAFVARIVLAKMAEQSLDVQYYLYHSDLSGGLLTVALWQAAERGVRVRILLDDMDMSGKDRNLAILTLHPNIEIRLFNPFMRGKSRTGQLVTGFGSVTRRMHNKAMIADNKLAIIGGRNVGDEYFQADPNLEFGDLDIAITEPAALSVAESFQLYWQSDLSYPAELLANVSVDDSDLKRAELEIEAFAAKNIDSAYVQASMNSDILVQAKLGKMRWYWSQVDILYDAPEKIQLSRDKTEFHLSTQLAPVIEAVDDEMVVISPYFVPGKSGVAFFQQLRDRGVTVKILTNSLASNDVSIVHSGYSRYRKDLLKMGVELYEIEVNAIANVEKKKKKEKKEKKSRMFSGSKSSLHAKFFIIDRETSFIGSLNLDPRSVVENTEIGAVIESKPMAEELVSEFNRNINTIAYKLVLVDGDIQWQQHNDGDVVTFDQEPDTSWWQRFSVGFMRVLPVESQL
ncbi:Cardiolipin synthase C [Sinobacterium norvegicum]|uniref:Cardiolipin synthase C n=1 Tax=Sinobacterium norvegicum TaxID=1641715 RepID=A0ABN8EHW6_9GAMM|nr:phospholipase D family protein [Sinobacterium norvegicum]CAH0991952.1 Cardiolipin synthase C [Sinobacterium norvegicum]